MNTIKYSWFMNKLKIRGGEPLFSLKSLCENISMELVVLDTQFNNAWDLAAYFLKYI
jgi:hypothetical protein